MIHTATLSTFLTREQYAAFTGLQGTVCHQQDGTYHNATHRASGVLLTAYSIKKCTYYSYYMTCRINFKRLIEQENRIVVYQSADYFDVQNAFDTAIQGLCKGLPLFTDWRVNRIDYCINVCTPYVREYLHLLRKGDMPPHLHIPYNAQRNYSYRTGSVYLTGNSTTINFYDKEQELKTQQRTDPCITDAIVVQAHNILRLEVQCKKPRTDYLKVKYDMDTTHLPHYLRDEIALNTVARALDSVTKYAEYKRHSVALEMIAGMDCTSRTKKNLTLLIDTVAKQYGSVYKARDKLIADGVCSKGTFNRYLRLLQAQNINAVTIPDNKHIADLKLLDGLPAVQDLLFSAAAGEQDESGIANIM